jgi:hypothetical protein
MKKTAIVSKGKIRIDNNDGTNTELDFVMPFEIAEEILSNIIDWKNNWVATTNTVEKFQEVSKEFLKQ